MSAALLMIVSWLCVDGNHSRPFAAANAGSLAGQPGLLMAETHEASIAETVGRKLRGALDQAYKKPRVTAGNPGQFDVTALIQEYLPVGTPIDQAIEILQFARFQIRRESRGDDTSQQQPQLVVASIEPFERHILWTYYSSLRVQLTPVQEAGVEVIGSVHARFKYPML
jgi:hypothetical protein